MLCRGLELSNVVAFIQGLFLGRFLIFTCRGGVALSTIGRATLLMSDWKVARRYYRYC